MDPITTTAGVTTLKTLWNGVSSILTRLSDSGDVSLTSYIKPLRICSRVYIDDSVYNDPVVTDVIKTVHTQYAGMILTALQMNRYVTKEKTVQSMLKVVSTEDNKIHESVVDELFGTEAHKFDADSDRRNKERIEDKKERATIRQRQNETRRNERAEDKNAKERAEKLARIERKNKAEADRLERQRARDEDRNAKNIQNAKDELIRKNKEKKEDDERKNRSAHTDNLKNVTGEIVSLSGDNHIPAGKLLEITLTNPENSSANITLNLMVQLAPYVVPSQLAVHFITKDVIPNLSQRILQWRTGEISFWKDLIFMNDVAKHREKLLRMDPTGILSEHMETQANNRSRVLGNIAVDAANRSRNIANSVLIFGQETIRRAKAESGIDLTKDEERQNFFATSFTMMIVIVDPLYNQVTFYYNGIDEAAVFSFDQMKVKTKGDNGLDLVAVMNALGQGRSPKF